MLFSLPVGTEMFHFPTFPPHTLYIQMRVTRHHSCWVSPFGHPRITARLTAPRGLSQPPTSFIGSWCQGIHRTLLNTYKTKMLASTVQFSNNTPDSNHNPHQPKISRNPRGMTEIRADHVYCLERTPVLSGPNSVLIYPPQPRTEPRPNMIETVSVPPMSNHRTTFEFVMALPQPAPTTVGRHGECSLERR